MTVEPYQTPTFQYVSWLTLTLLDTEKKASGLPVHLGRPLPNASLTPQLPERSSGLTLSCLHNSQCREPQTAVPGLSQPSAWLLWNPIPWLTSDLTSFRILFQQKSGVFLRTLFPLRPSQGAGCPSPAPSLSPSLRVAVLLASHHWPHLPLLLQPARPRQPLRSRLTTPYFLTAVVLRPSSFPPLLIQSHTFPTRPSSFLRFTIYTDDSLLRWHILILSVILVFNLVKCSQHHALDTVISTDCNSFINWIPKHPWHSSSPPSAVSTSKFWSHWDLK